MTTREYINRLRAKKERLRIKLKHAEDAEWNWPSTRARCAVMRVEKEIDDINFKLFARP